MKKLRLYLDTSVLGGYFDDEFSDPTKQLFELIRLDIYKFILSDLTKFELYKASEELIRKVLKLLSAYDYEQINETSESRQLAQFYVDLKVLSTKNSDDARHVALATCECVDYIISWNFKHLVNVERIRGFNAINLKMGYTMIDIRSPLEVIVNA